VRVLIQNCLTGKFLGPSKKWVSDPKNALNFEKTLRAWTQIDDAKLSGVRIVLNVGEGVPDVPLAKIGDKDACGNTVIG
jgi:hypothetical protein